MEVVSSRRTHQICDVIAPTHRQHMPSSTYALFRHAILAEQQVICTYDGRHRELCPHIIGTNKSGEEVVLAWQFAGESSGSLPHGDACDWPTSEMRMRATAAGMKAARTARSRRA